MPCNYHNIPTNTNRSTSKPTLTTSQQRQQKKLSFYPVVWDWCWWWSQRWSWCQQFANDELVIILVRICTVVCRRDRRQWEGELFKLRGATDHGTTDRGGGGISGRGTNRRSWIVWCNSSNIAVSAAAADVVLRCFQCLTFCSSSDETNDSKSSESHAEWIFSIYEVLLAQEL